jgi:glutamate-1-semialdehyde aminotransferase
VNDTIEKARELLDNAGSDFLQTERGKCLESTVEQLAAEKDAYEQMEQMANKLRGEIAAVIAEQSERYRLKTLEQDAKIAAVTTERDNANALAKNTERLKKAQTELLILQSQLAGYLLSIACNDSRNDIIFATLGRAQSAIDAQLARTKGDK